MSDFADHGAEAADYMLTVALRQHAMRKVETEINRMCIHCETNASHVTKLGVVLCYCTRCALELGHEAIENC